MVPASSPRRPKRPETSLAGWMLIVLAVPRVARLLYPQVWVEDDFYLESAYLVSIGMRPYLDFVHPHMPLLEWFTAGYIRIFGASHFSVEVLNQAAIYATSVMTLALAARAVEQRTAIFAAILYAFSSLVFRYHVYERECFVGALVAAAALAATSERATMARLPSLAALLAIACAIKLTAIVPAAAILCFLAIVRRRWLEAAAAAIGIAGALAAFSAILYRLYGFEFVFQTFVFHLMKGREPLAEIITYPRAILDVVAPLFVLGCIRLAVERRLSPALWLVLMLVTFNYIFFGLLSPTAWGHNYLDFLPYLAIVAALGLERMWRAVRESQWRAAGASMAFIFVCLIWLTPIINENWLHGSVYGFGFIGREELRELSEGLREASAPNEPVIAPAFVCFEANRREMIRFPETLGVYREAERLMEKQGFFAARAALADAGFFELINRTAGYWEGPMRRAIASGQINAIIPDSPAMLLPIVSLSPEYLSANGFAPYLRTEHFVLWRRARSDRPGKSG